MVKNNDNIMPIVTHILGYFTGFLGPLILYFASNDNKTKKHAKKCLNWNISLIIYMFVGGILTIILVGFLLLGILGILTTVFHIIAIVKAAEGRVWDYPMSIKFFK
jgi:uncharacterized Tic20 family protein